MKKDHTLAFYAIKLLEVLEEQGVDVRPYLTSTMLNPGVFTDKQQLLPIAKFIQLIETVLTDTDIPALGLRVGARATLKDHGVIGYSVLNSTNLAEAIDRQIRYAILLGEVLEFQLLLDNTQARITAKPYERHQLSARVVRYLAEEWIGHIHDMGAAINAGAQWLSAVALAYPMPTCGDVYTELLGCPVSFAQAETAVFFPASHLQLPFNYPDEQVDVLCEEQCEQLLEDLQLERGLTREIHHLLTRAMGHIPTILAIADKFNISGSTLNRRLREENMTYQQIVLDFRLGMAKTYLLKTPLPANEVAVLVGYADPPSFYRAFRKRFGISPHVFRA